MPKRFIICEKDKLGRSYQLKGMAFHGLQAALKTCISKSVVHKDTTFFVYDKMNHFYYGIEKFDPNA